MGKSRIIQRKSSGKFKKTRSSKNKHTAKGTYFLITEMLFLLECSRAGADVLARKPNLGREFKYPSYIQDIMGSMCFDYGFRPSVGLCFRKT